MSDVVVERLEVDDLSALDRYEGYYESDPEGSLFVRRPSRDGWIYEFNGPVSGRRLIESGDFLAFKSQKKGHSAHLIAQAQGH